MDLSGWNQRYLAPERADEDLLSPPSPLVVRTAEQLTPGTALDLACGTGRNAIWLAEHGWATTAVDGAAAAIEHLQRRAGKRNLPIQTQVADLASGEYQVEPGTWDLIIICYYLQRDLLRSAFAGLRPGGILVAIVHITEGAEEPTAHRLRPGELGQFFPGAHILHYREGQPEDPAHRRAAAEIAVCA